MPIVKIVLLLTYFSKCNYFVRFAMLINIKDIPKGHTVIEQDVTMTEEQIQDTGFAGNVFCRAEIDRIQFQIYIHVSYTCNVKQECSRCLEEIEFPVKGDFDIVLQDRNALGKIEDDDSDSFDYYFSERDAEIDMRQSLYEEVMVNLPIKPLCKTDCQGVTDYIEKDKGTEEVIDPRWEALKKIKRNSK